jgi:serine/threonine-protein kinase
VLHQIGSGVLGPVFRTYDPQRDRLIAVKAFRLDLVPEDVARLAEAFRRLAAASLSYPSLVPAVDGGLEGATAFLAMDYVAGETLDVAFRHLAPAPLDRALPVLTQIADALEAGWAAGLGHGALHPRDVFLTAGADEVRVTGVGVVQALEATGVKAPVRRPYTAPERAAGEPWDVRADVYSLGAITHELLTRRRPAGPGEQDGALATGLTPEQRVHVRKILSAALSERPEFRFATPKAFADALAAVARGESPVLPPEPEAIAALPSEKPAAARKRSPAPTPLLETMEPPVESGTVAIVPVPAVPQTSPDNPTDTPLSHFSSERPREPEPPPPVPAAVRETTPEPPPPPPTPPPMPAIERTPLIREESGPAAAAGATIHRPEPFTTRARSVPPPFMMSTFEAPSFPWGAFAAVAVVCILGGGVGGYAIGVHRASTALQTPAPAERPTADTDVQVPPAPVTTPIPEPVTPHAASPASTPKSAPAPAVTLPPQQGSLVVRSSPSGALVMIDGKAHGTTPTTVRELLLGSHTLQVARPGYVPNSQPVVLTSSQPSKEINVELQASADTRPPQPGSIFVDTRPRGARVTIDGHSVGTTPVRARALTPGQHAVRIEMDGYKPVVTTVDVKPGTEVPVAVTLELSGLGFQAVPEGSKRFQEVRRR